MKELEKDRITVGLATCGISAGAQKTFDKLAKSKLNLEIVSVGCAGMCYAEPIVTVRKNGKLAIYGYVTEDKVDLLSAAINNNKICKELYLGESLEKIDYYKKQKRILMENCGKVDPSNINHYFETGGYDGLKKAITLTQDQLIEEIKKSGLRGRGGAGFPTGLKWSFIAKAKGKKILVCNGDEGDPGAFMNRTVMESDPFHVLEGIAIAAYAIGAEEGIIYTRAEYPLAIKTLQKAIDIAEKNNLLGKNILNKFNFHVKIQKGAGAFVCGEETALIASVEGKRGNPRSRPPYPAAHGIHGYPTNINNVGTLSSVATIMKIGAKNYAKIGSKTTKGTKVVCLTGKIKRSGVIEVPMGITLREIIYDIGGGILNNAKFKAIQAGGPSGGCIIEKDLDTPLDYESLQKVGAIMGSGGLVVLDEKSCMVDVAKFFMNFEATESCGKCTPCREGTTRMLEILEKITQGRATIDDLKLLETLAYYIKENSLCGLGQSAPNPTLSTMKNFMDEYLCHIEKKTCPSHACEKLLTYTITKKCIGCGNCIRHCPVNCITGKPKEVHLIDQSKCIKCGACYDVCAFDAITRK